MKRLHSILIQLHTRYYYSIHV